jgi:phosphatidate cytidylyltransferase
MKLPADLITRIATAAVIITVTTLALLSGTIVFGICCVLLAAGMLQEWRELTYTMRSSIFFGGAIVIASAVSSAVIIRAAPNGLVFLGFLIACVSATDIFAYFGGKAFGKRKLAPSISPNKTVEGLLCGACASGITAASLTLTLGLPMPAYISFGLGIVLACVAQLGDLLESAAKRSAGVKDSGTLLPGHGGLLDRADGYITALPVYYLILYLSQHLSS